MGVNIRPAGRDAQVPVFREEQSKIIKDILGAGHQFGALLNQAVRTDGLRVSIRPGTA